MWVCEFEMVKCFFRIKALAGGDGHGDSFPIWPEVETLHSLQETYGLKNASGYSE